MLNRVAIGWLALMTLAPMAFSQEPEPKVDIYALALVAAANEMDRQWGDMSFGPLDNRIPTDYTHVLVQKEASVETEYPSVSGERKSEFLTGPELRTRRSRSKGDFSALRVNPAKVAGPRVKVVVSQDWITLRKGQLVLLTSDWAIVFFRFDAAAGMFRVDEVQLGGI